MLLLGLSCHPGKKLTIESGAYVMVLKVQSKEKNSQDKLQEILKNVISGKKKKKFCFLAMATR